MTGRRVRRCVSCLVLFDAFWQSDAVLLFQAPGGSENRQQPPTETLQEPSREFLEPGCYLWAPSGCPLQPQFSARTWKIDHNGAAKSFKSRTACEVTRKSEFVTWCGTEEARTAFAPPKYFILETPTEPGCYVAAPKWCPRAPKFTSNYWWRDLHGEDETDARLFEAACLDRKRHYDTKCGVTDMMMKFVPPAEGNESIWNDKGEPFQPGCYVKANACPGQPGFATGVWKREKNDKEITDKDQCLERQNQHNELCGVHDVKMRFITDSTVYEPPSEPGCYVQAPTVCPSQQDFTPGQWKRDMWGETNKGARENEAACLSRKASFDAWCGVDNMVVRFVPGAQAAPAEPLTAPADSINEPGCYVMTPSTCQREPSLSGGAWRRDMDGEVKGGAKESEEACKIRKATFDAICGVKDAIMRYVPISGVAPSIQSGGSEGQVDASKSITSAGCYVMVPSACPEQPNFGTGIWKRDAYGEKYKNSGKSEAECLARKGNFDEFCGVDNAVMRFVGAKDAVGISVVNVDEPGCYVKVPSECPKQPRFPTGAWKRDKFGEENKNAASSEEQCLARKASFDTYCGVEDSMMRFVAPMAAEASEPAPQIYQVDNSPDASNLRPGCYVQAPTWCPKNTEFTTGKWYRDLDGESNTGAADDEAACAARRGVYNKMCGVVDVKSKFVPPPVEETTAPPTSVVPQARDTVMDAPSVGDHGLPTPPEEPGCYIMAPSTCPFEPSFVLQAWRHDKYGESELGADTDEDACKKRKAIFDSFCGTKDIEMHFVPIASDEHDASKDEANDIVNEPMEPGCYMQAPTTCPQQPGFTTGQWVRDYYGEEMTRAGFDEKVCEQERKAHFNEWCGSSDIQSMFIPPAVERLPEVQEPGCYIRAPAGCPAQPNMTFAVWKHDVWAEENLNAVYDRAGCESRKPSFDEFCGIDDAEMRFVPGPDFDKLTRPHQPGCYVYARHGCPRQPDFKAAWWAHDRYGEVNLNASTDRVMCEEVRRKSLSKWCGSDELLMEYIPEVRYVPANISQPSESLDDLLESDGPTVEAEEAGKYRLKTAGQKELMGFTVPSAPIEPGCYYWTPSGCPDLPEMSTKKWEHDRHGEIFRSSAHDRMICHRNRQYWLSKHCGAAVVTYFVPMQLMQGDSKLKDDGGFTLMPRAPKLPESPGCYVWAPKQVLLRPKKAGCPLLQSLNPEKNTSDWVRDNDGEAFHTLTPKVACLGERLGELQHACGTTRLKVAYVPAKAKTPPLPMTTGCYVWAPSGCPRHASFKATNWTSEIWGDPDAKVHTNKIMCQVMRKHDFREWCGAEDVQVTFVAAPPKKPTEAGCYMWAPSGCRKHPHFVTETWIHDSFGEKNMSASEDRAVCEGWRLQQYNHWCGVRDIQVLFVPKYLPRAESSKAILTNRKAPDFPKLPGCYFWFPDGCRWRPAASRVEWVHDDWAEINTDALTNRTTCELKRLTTFQKWCGQVEVKAKWIAPLPAYYKRMEAEEEDGMVALNHASSLATQESAVSSEMMRLTRRLQADWESLLLSMDAANTDLSEEEVKQQIDQALELQASDEEENWEDMPELASRGETYMLPSNLVQDVWVQPAVAVPGVWVEDSPAL